MRETSKGGRACEGGHVHTYPSVPVPKLFCTNGYRTVLDLGSKPPPGLTRFAELLKCSSVSFESTVSVERRGRGGGKVGERRAMGERDNGWV